MVFLILPNLIVYHIKLDAYEAFPIFSKQKLFKTIIEFDPKFQFCTFEITQYIFYGEGCFVALFSYSYVKARRELYGYAWEGKETNTSFFIMN